MNAAQLFVKCLENEGVEYIFGVPGEENLGLMDALLDSSIEFIATRHEQGAASELAEILKIACAQPTVSVSDYPVDYQENLKLTEQLGRHVCPT